MQARITYLDNSGFAVKTERNFLIFDCWNKHPTGGKQGLAGGVIDPEELADEHVTVFVSHAHGDHYNPMIFKWAEKIPDIRYVLSDDIRPHPGALAAAPSRDYSLGGMDIKTFRSTDEGVAFLVDVDGLAVYHAGDLNWWHWEGEDPAWNAQMARDYKNEINRMAGSRIDLAFLPVDPRLGGSMLLGIEYFMEHVGAKRAVPMHYGGAGAKAAHALRASRVLAPFRSRIVMPMERGESILL
ncbi:MBL fold metallo-hydrolase [Christensenella intestinihominis]|uniref:MBL fold metallo-hydrolase n=1 Tax=Christensenella intestinihominis TaxID=1851429 RepID=UPI00082A630D|nr:MBL fold metallo-hydrolase [Christensenella intestinihominis]